MKKLKLKLEGISEMLTREQMKKVNGGYGEECGGMGACFCDTGTGDTVYIGCYGTVQCVDTCHLLFPGW